MAMSDQASPRVDGPPTLPDMHPALRVVVTKIERPSADTVAKYRKLYTGHVLDHLGKHGAMHSSIKPVFAGARICGPAVTVFGPDWRLRFTAADIAQSGDIIVMTSGSVDHACFGDVTATRWKAKGIGGFVIDGAVRDVGGLRALAFPTFARNVTPRTFHYPAGVDHGAVNVPIACGGIVVTPGDMIVGDEDGVVVIPRTAAAEIADTALAYLGKETAKKEAFARGEIPTGIAADELLQRGYRFI
jgi:4-hydroxy-4-methyl-2-oxoglutarate aldolase